MTARLAWLARGDYRASLGHHIAIFYAQLRDHPETMPRHLLDAAFTYFDTYLGPQHCNYQRKLIHDPVQRKGGPLRFLDLGEVTALPRILEFAEQLAKQLGQANAGPPPRRSEPMTSPLLRQHPRWRRVRLVVVRPPGMPEPHSINDVVDSLYHALQFLGCTVDAKENDPLPDGTNIFFRAHLLPASRLAEISARFGHLQFGAGFRSVAMDRACLPKLAVRVFGLGLQPAQPGCDKRHSGSPSSSSRAVRLHAAIDAHTSGPNPGYRRLILRRRQSTATRNSSRATAGRTTREDRDADSRPGEGCADRPVESGAEHALLPERDFRDRPCILPACQQESGCRRMRRAHRNRQRYPRSDRSGELRRSMRQKSAELVANNDKRLELERRGHEIFAARRLPDLIAQAIAETETASGEALPRRTEIDPGSLASEFPKTEPAQACSEKSTSTRTPKTKRILFHAINGNGLGHVVRLSVIARSLQDHDGDVAFFSTCPFANQYWPGKIFTVPDRLDDRFELNSEQRNRLGFHLALNKFSPDVVVFDTHWPHTIIDKLRENNVRTVLVLRTMLLEEMERALRLAIRDFSSVLIPHHPVEVEQTYRRCARTCRADDHRAMRLHRARSPDNHEQG